ncbi:PilN domain-containing protein [Candidatus Babeliales bacterium]|nr:PilN domain-containing protein [Candidatus Babeliales bacterium]
MANKKIDEKKVYLEIHNTYILLVLLTQQKKEFALDATTTQIVPLNNLEFDEGVVNNPTTISRFIKNYIESHNLKKPEGVVCLRNADKTKENQQKFMTLQIALLVAKAGIKISEIVHGPIMPWNNTSMLHGKIPKKELSQKFNLFKILTPPSYTNPQRWIIASALSIIFCSILMIKQYNNKRNELNVLELTHNNLTKEKDLLSQKTQKATPLPEDQLKEEITVNPDEDCSYGELLRILTKSLPETAWFKSLKKDSLGNLEIAGNTLSDKEVSKLLKNLEKTQFFENLTLGGLELIKEKSSKVYSFKILGKLS